MKTWIEGLGRIEIDMTLEQAQSVSHQGQCDEDVAVLIETPEIKAQLDVLNEGLIAEVLKEYGAWDDKQLADNEQNRHRLIWIAGCDIAEEN